MLSIPEHLWDRDPGDTGPKWGRWDPVVLWDPWGSGSHNLELKWGSWLVPSGSLGSTGLGSS